MLEEAGVFITFHASDNGYHDVYRRHAMSDAASEYLPFNQADPLALVMDTNHRAHADHLAAIVCHGLFERHPKLKVGYIETGVAWLYPLWERMALVHKMAPQLFKRHPHEVILEHVWFHPHFEEMEHGQAKRLLPHRLQAVVGLVDQPVQLGERRELGKGEAARGAARR